MALKSGLGEMYFCSTSPRRRTNRFLLRRLVPPHFPRSARSQRGHDAVMHLVLLETDTEHTGEGVKPNPASLKMNSLAKRSEGSVVEKHCLVPRAGLLCS